MHAGSTSNSLCSDERAINNRPVCEEKCEMKRNGKTALVVEGGAMRGIFSTGILDSFLKKSFNPFDICIGTSAGALNVAAFLAGMYKRNYTIYTDYSLRKDFINVWKFIRGGHLVDLDWMWNITISEVRLNLDAIMKNKSDFYAGLTDVKTGKAVYIKPTKKNLEQVIKGSSAIPIFYRKFIEINGSQYADGGVADPIPVQEAYRQGATNILVLRSRPYSKTVEPGSEVLLSRLVLRKHPGLIQAILNRSRVYQESIDFMRNPPKGITIIEINPPEDFKTSRLTKDKSVLDSDYEKGVKIGMQIVRRWK
jgi:predicted patatin/cPLA2 family phospholipase